MTPTWQTPDGSVRLYLGDCRSVMPSLEAGSIDAVIADLPYGTTACKWDTVIPFEDLWANYKRLVKRNAAIVLTASQPFTSALVMSQPKWFKYSWEWRKNRGTGFVNAKHRPLKIHEDVLVFSPAGCTTGSNPLMKYNPQGLRVANRKMKNSKSAGGGSLRDSGRIGQANCLHQSEYIQEFEGYPSSVLDFATDQIKLHPTQKPVALMEYLTLTYTNEGETVLDNTMGSGTTGIACLRTARKFIGIEKDPDIFETARKRIEAELAKQPLLEGVA